MERNYKSPDFGVTPTYQVSTAGVADAQFRTGGETLGVKNSSRSTITHALMGLIPQFANVADKELQISEQNAYLEGAAKVGQIESEEEIKSNPLTRDWEVAGYRDTQNRMALVEADTQAQSDMETLRTQPPEAMQKYLAQRRGQLVQQFAGSSQEARSSLMTRLLESDNTLIRKHAGEYQNYVQGVKQKALFTDWSNQSINLTEARKAAEMNPEDKTLVQDYQNRLRSSVVFMGDMLTDPTLHEGSKAALTKEIVEDAMVNGNGALYALLRKPIAEGQPSVISRLPIKDQQALSQKYAEFKDKYNLNMTQDQRLYAAKVTAPFHDPSVATYAFANDEQGAAKFVSQMVSSGVFNGGDVESFWNNHFEWINRNAGKAMLTGYLNAGDVQGILNSKHTMDDAWKAFETMHAQQGSTVAMRVHNMLQIGANGIPEAYEKIGQLAGPLFQQLADPVTGKANLQNQQLFLEVTQALDAAERPGPQNNPFAAGAIYRGMNNDQAIMMQRIRQNMKTMPLDQAIIKSAEARAKDEALGPNRAAAAGAKLADDQKALKDFAPQTRWDQFKNFFFGKPEDTLKPRKSLLWESNEKVLNRMAGQMRAGIDEEMRDLRMVAPYDDSKTLMQTAVQHAVARTVVTEQGPLMLPKGQTVQGFFGVDGSVGRDTVGKAIDEILPKPVAGGHYTFSTASGALYATEEHDDPEKKGRPFLITPESVKEKVKEMDAKRFDSNARTYGLQGRQVNDKDGNLIAAYNGLNTAGVQPSWMMEYRENLVKNEGMYADVREDSLGNPTAGGGLLVTHKATGKPGDWAPKVGPYGKVDPKELSIKFNDATDAAAIRATANMDDFKLTGKSAFLLNAELAHQAGMQFLKKDEYQRVMTAIAGRDVKAAQEAFQATSAYAVSGATRKQHYLDLVEQATKGY